MPASEPNQAEALLNWGNLRFQEGAANQVPALFRRAVESDPNNEQARDCRRKLGIKPFRLLWKPGIP